MSSPPPPGIYVPAVIFFTPDEELDTEAIQAHVLRLAEGGVTGILVQGSNGEAQHLTPQERKAAISLTRNTLDAHGFAEVAVIAGTGAQSTRETIQLCRDAKEAGATHALVLTPSTWFQAMTKDKVLRFHREVADASPIPTMVYNFPSVTAGQDLDSDVIFALSQHPNIVGTKLSCGNIGKLQRLTSATSPDAFAVFPGKSDVFIQGLLSGSAGVVGALVNIAPKAHKRALDLWNAGKVKEAVQAQAQLGKADWELRAVGGIGGIKALVVKHFGYGGPTARGPLGSLSEEHLESIDHPGVKAIIELEKSL